MHLPALPLRALARAAVALAIAVALAGCGGRAAIARPVAPPPLRVAFFGSSTTAGVGATAPARAWSALVSRALRWTPVNLGLSGSKLTGFPGERIASGEARWEAVAAARPDVVVVMYGANDAAGGIPLGDAATPRTFRHAAAVVLGGLHAALPDALLVVMTPQPARVLEGKRAPYDAALEEAARAAGAVLLRADRAFAEERLPALAADGYHLNDRGHAALARFVRDAVHARVWPALTARCELPRR